MINKKLDAANKLVTWNKYDLTADELIKILRGAIIRKRRDSECKEVGPFCMNCNEMLQSGDGDILEVKGKKMSICSRCVEAMRILK